MAFEAVIDRLNVLGKASETFPQWLEGWLQEMGNRALAETKQRTSVRTGALRRAWFVSGVLRDGNTLYVLLVNQMNYASFVEHGWHQRRRWVPGYWQGGRFRYAPNNKKGTGMRLREKDIPGQKMVTVALEHIRQQMPSRFARDFAQWWRNLEG